MHRQADALTVLAMDVKANNERSAALREQIADLRDQLADARSDRERDELNARIQQLMHELDQAQEDGAELNRQIQKKRQDIEYARAREAQRTQSVQRTRTERYQRDSRSIRATD